MRRLLALVALVLAAGVGNTQAMTITFEDHAVPSGTALPLSGDPTSGGFFFDMASNVYQFANNSARVDDGSTYMVIEGAPLSQTTFSQIGGAPFALTSIDFAEWQSDLNPLVYPRTITVTGNQVGGTTVFAMLHPDGIFDGPGGQLDFQTAFFGSEWANLSSVIVLGTGGSSGFPGLDPLNYLAIDNVVVNPAAVPDPGNTLTLLGLSSAYLIRRRRNLG